MLQYGHCEMKIVHHILQNYKLSGNPIRKIGISKYCCKFIIDAFEYEYEISISVSGRHGFGHDWSCLDRIQKENEKVHVNALNKLLQSFRDESLTSFEFSHQATSAKTSVASGRRSSQPACLLFIVHLQKREK